MSLPGLAREVEEDRARLRHDDAVVVDHGKLAERIFGAERVAVEVVVRMIHADDLER